MNLSPGYTTTGTVVSIDSAGRLHVRVPEIHGPDPSMFSEGLDTSDFTKDDDLPASKVLDTGSSVKYAVKDIVYVMFPSGSLSVPLVIGLAAKYNDPSTSSSGTEGDGSSSAVFDQVLGGTLSSLDPCTPVKVNTVITSPFGPRWGSIHRGIDIGVGSGTPIYSILNGLVVKKLVDKETDWWGGHVIVSHGTFNGKALYTGYAHIREFSSIKLNQVVQKGELLGYSGGGLDDPHHGNSTGPHLHFEVYSGSTSSNQRINPASCLSYFNGGADGASLRWGV